MKIKNLESVEDVPAEWILRNRTSCLIKDIPNKAMKFLEPSPEVEQAELMTIYNAPYYDHDNIDLDSQLVFYRWEKWLKMNNNGRDQLVIQKIFIKPDNSMSPEEWIYNATHFPKIPALRVANMAEMYDMIRNGDPFLSNESVDIAYMSSSRCGCSYYTWFPTNYKWEYFSSVHWGNTFLEHQLALRCLIDFPIL